MHNGSIVISTRFCPPTSIFIKITTIPGLYICRIYGDVSISVISGLFVPHTCSMAYFMNGCTKTTSTMNIYGLSPTNLTNIRPTGIVSILKDKIIGLSCSLYKTYISTCIYMGYGTSYNSRTCQTRRYSVINNSTGPSPGSIRDYPSFLQFSKNILFF